MLKVAIVCFHEHTPEIKKIIAHPQFEIVEMDPDVVISFGGDGTFIKASKIYGPTPRYVAVNTGTLGFYTS